VVKERLIKVLLYSGYLKVRRRLPWDLLSVKGVKNGLPIKVWLVKGNDQ